MRKIPQIAFSVFAILFGIFMFVYGGFDDSPGAQVIGLLAAALGITGLVKRARTKNKGAKRKPPSK